MNRTALSLALFGFGLTGLIVVALQAEYFTGTVLAELLLARRKTYLWPGSIPSITWSEFFEHVPYLRAFRWYLFVAPAILLATALLFRVRTSRTMLVATLMPIAFLAILMAFVPKGEVSENLFLLLVLASTLNIIVIGSVMALLDWLSPPFHATGPTLTSPERAGVSRYPIRTWLILGVAFVSMQLIVDVAELASQTLWSHVDFFFDTSSWRTHHAYLDGVNDNLHLMEIKIGLHAIALYVLPFLFLVLAMRLRMRPWYGWVFGLLSSVVLGIWMWCFSSRYCLYELGTMALITGELFGMISVLTLWVYHSNVSKIQFDDEEALEY